MAQQWLPSQIGTEDERRRYPAPYQFEGFATWYIATAGGAAAKEARETAEADLSRLYQMAADAVFQATDPPAIAYAAGFREVRSDE